MSTLRGATILSLAGAVPAAAGAQQRTSAPTSLVFDSVTVVDVDHGELVPNQRVVIAGNHIRATGAVSTVKVPKGARVVSAQGKYLIPGLWDMHTHVAGRPQIFFPLLVANGVTGIRDMHQSFFRFDSVLQWRRDILAGRRVGPRLVATGGFLTTVAPGTFNGPFVVYVATPAGATHSVDSLKAAGVDFIKVREMARRDIYFAIVAAARRAGLPLVGHRPDSVTGMEASDSGQRSLEHGGFGACIEGDSAGTAACRLVMTHLFRNETWVTPTLLIYNPAYRKRARDRAGYWPKTTPTEAGGMLGSFSEELRLRHRQAVHGMRRFGTPLLAGTDVSDFLGAPGFGLHEELALLVDAGLTPLEALQAATLNPAKYLRATDSLGTVARGKLADLVLLDADPLADISNTTAIRAVVANGRYFDRAALDALLAEVRAKAEQNP